MIEYKSLPTNIKTFACHGVDSLEDGGDGNWGGDCPFCGKELHFFMNADTGKWDCKVCGKVGNIITFLGAIAAERHTDTTRGKWRRLSQDRGIPVRILMKRKLGWDSTNKCWLIPCHSESGTVRDIRRWSKKGMKTTAGCKTQLFGADQLAVAKRGARVWLCEGEWDAMAMDWLLAERGLKDDVVVAVPGATIFKKDWVKMFAGLDVMTLYDADEAGDKGMEIVQRRLGGVTRNLWFVNWSETIKSGYDLRDFMQDHFDSDDEDDTTLEKLLGLFESRTRRDVTSSGDAGEEPQEDIDPIELDELLATFEEHLEMRADLVIALKVILAVCLSNDIKGDPLWVYVVGPPGSGKTMLLSALQKSARTIFRSTLTAHGLVSGWRGDGEDPSLIPKLIGKTFVAKDFTEVLDMPINAQEEIFSTLRGAYDGSVQKQFGNGVMREYYGHFSFLAGVTNTIHGHRKAHLGERFLKVLIKQPSRAQATAVTNAALGSIGREHVMEDALQDATRRYLARRADIDSLPRFSKHHLARINALVQLIATMRSQVERDWHGGELLYKPEPEAGNRLAKQLGKLAMMVGFVNGDEDEISDDTYAVMERVAFDTGYGFNLDIVDAVMTLGGRATKSEVVQHTELPASTLARRFEDLVMLKVLKHDGEQKGEKPGRPAKVYAVSKDIATLWNKAKGVEDVRHRRNGSRVSSARGRTGGHRPRS